MSHVIAGGATSQTKNMVGKRLGVKKYAGEVVRNGNILVRQRGSVFHAGKNTKLAKDYSVYAIADGYVSFRHMTGNKRSQYYIDVLPTKKEVKTDVVLEKNKIESTSIKATAKASTIKKESVKKAPVKKIAVKKASVKKVVKKVAKK
jgi:large subunit ribosomal protein L27